MNKDRIANYSATETLRKGGSVTIRAIRPDDAGLVAAGLRRVSHESLYQRTFSARKVFNDKEIARLVNIDLERIVALVAVMQAAGEDLIVGEGRYVRLGGADGTVAEVAFIVDEERKGQGVGTLLFRHLAAIARSAGVAQFEASVFASNKVMLYLFDRSGLTVTKARDKDTVRVMIELNA